MTYRSVFVDTGENYYTGSCYFNVANYSVALFKCFIAEKVAKKSNVGKSSY